MNLELLLCEINMIYYYNHRLSKDIDIFIDDMQLLNSLSPGFNDILGGKIYETSKYIRFK